MEKNVFSLDDMSQYPSPFQKTVLEMKRSLIEYIAIPDEALVIASYSDGRPIDYAAPYFMNPQKRSKFLSAWNQTKLGTRKGNKPAGFIIVMNYFGPDMMFYSHALACVKMPNKEEYFLFDPNGDHSGGSVYSSPSFNDFTQVDKIANPLYRVVLYYMKEKMGIATKNVNVFSGGMIPCPYIAGSCIYRAYAFILAFVIAHNDFARAVDITFYISTNKDLIMAVLGFSKNYNFKKLLQSTVTRLPPPPQPPHTQSPHQS